MSDGARVLIVEDEPAVARAMALLLELHDIGSVTARSPEEALELIARETFAVIIQDMNFTPGETSGREGETLFRRLRAEQPEVPVLVVTAFASLEAAVRLVKEGAEDYLEKPWSDTKLVTSVRNLVHLGGLRHENAELRARGRRARAELASRYDLCGMVYASDEMHELVLLATRVARSDAPVLITGGNGTGKEKLAEVIQANSDRRDRPFVKVDAGALPDTLLEAELFGSEAGAYTGATRRRIGRFERADGGTLLLDEIGNLSAPGQAKLLRVLQTGELERLGSSTTLKVDVRVIAATNTDLAMAIADGRFREDLYFRLNVVELAVPPLAERRADILPLAERLLLEHLPGPDGCHRRLSEASLEALGRHDWPGNVRELANCLQRAALVATGREIEPVDLGLGPAAVAERAGSDLGVGLGPEAGGQDRRHDGADQAERRRIEQILLRHQGVVSRAAAELGLSRQALYRRMGKLGIVLERRLGRVGG